MTPYELVLSPQNSAAGCRQLPTYSIYSKLLRSLKYCAPRRINRLGFHKVIQEMGLPTHQLEHTSSKEHCVFVSHSQGKCEFLTNKSHTLITLKLSHTVLSTLAVLHAYVISISDLQSSISKFSQQCNQHVQYKANIEEKMETLNSQLSLLQKNNNHLTEEVCKILKI